MCAGGSIGVGGGFLASVGGGPLVALYSMWVSAAGFFLCVWCSGGMVWVLVWLSRLLCDVVHIGVFVAGIWRVIYFFFVLVFGVFYFLFCCCFFRFSLAY